MNCERNICYQQDYNGGCDTCPCNRTTEKNSNVEMTYEEAIVKFKGIMKAEIDRIPCQYDAEVEDDVYSDIDKVNEILQVNKVICGALEKQVPKMPDYEGDGYADGELVYDTWICPRCGRRYEVDYDDYIFCPNCGQAIKQDIDWSDEK